MPCSIVAMVSPLLVPPGRASRRSRANILPHDIVAYNSLASLRSWAAGNRPHSWAQPIPGVKITNVREAAPHGARRDTPHHLHHRRRAPERALLRRDTWVAHGEEVRKPRRSDRLPPVLCERRGRGGLRHHLLRVSRGGAGPSRRRHDLPGPVAGGLGGEPRLLGAAARIPGCVHQTRRWHAFLRGSRRPRT